jgi:sugar phosphate isomerase/epimerase
MSPTKLFASVWSCGSWDSAFAFAEAAGLDGIEGPPPQVRPGRPWILEIATGGGYVPRAGAGVAEHLEDFARILEAGRPFDPLFATCLGGSDAWSLDEAADFVRGALGIAARSGVGVAFETHRSRPTFHPLPTCELLRRIPEMQLTCDFSHWCCVCERPVLDEMPEVLELCAARCRHLHLRVGHAQGPQVADPRSPHHRTDLEAHLRWWRRVAALSPATPLTATPEFGPDGYQPLDAATGRPVGGLAGANRFVAEVFRAALSPDSSWQ